ncbi:MAG TPA: DUF4340 domain-containing protein [Leptospiraceae bacterium]|nr:DUF4340 domain-containing protein [Leptospiraceae bacterium]HMY68002.1 DUF4340 domain-containing protein [Leptospiraceae bacterium]HMZ59233.1 DUF4340 domain-containing protein [Leptospiraceae bacterium]HNF15708.1 DUF4340 domain-containing protein [Leptospiraceae bacterium]HNF26807.1 DUF4340 domain-containing protein [Leptospiraceae bacterium]
MKLKWISEHKAFSLTAANLILILLLFFTKDPFSLFSRTYDRAENFFKISEKDVQKIRLAKPDFPDYEKEISRDGMNWELKVKSGKKFRADSEKTETLLKSLLGAKKFTVITSSKEKGAEFGVTGGEAIEAELFDKAGSLGKITVGTAGGGGSFTHIKWNGGDEIYLVEDNLKAAAGRGADDFFFDKKISPSGLTSSDIITVSLKDSSALKRDFEVQKAEKDWTAVKPATGPISSEEISSLLSRLSSLSADEVISDEKKIPELDKKDSVEIRFSFKKGAESGSVVLNVLGKDTKGNHYYAVKNNEPTVYRMSEYSLKQILEFKPGAKPAKQ